MSLADDLNAPPLARRVAEIIRKHAAEIDATTEEWTLMAALRVLVEVERLQAATTATAVQRAYQRGREDGMRAAGVPTVTVPDADEPCPGGGGDSPCVIPAGHYGDCVR